MGSAKTVSGSMQPGRLKRWLREPLLHFLLIGMVMFVVYHALHPNSAQGDRLSRIELTADDLRQLEVAWAAKWQRPPGPEELRNLVAAKVREEILYREGLALGLDKEDTIVKRRMAQKVEFLSEDVSTMRDPGVKELKAWFEENASRFALPSRVTFRHLFFSFDRRGEGSSIDASRALAKLAGQAADSPVTVNLADPFMYQSYYADRTPEYVANVFGTKFAQALAQLKPAASWQGPIESGFGWHLVWVDSLTPGRILDFEEVEPEVKNEWIAEQRAEARRKAFEAMKTRYEIILPKAGAQGVAVAGTTPIKKAP
ncbi:MAG: peptidyl-prolyl cis-trans isomerase [Desulfobaccales bacterium]